MTATDTPPVRRKIIGNRLRGLREARGLSVDEVAVIMGVSRAAAYRQETGHTSVSLADVEKYFRIYEVQNTPIADHIAHLVIGDKMRGWRKTPKSLRTYGSQPEVAELEDIADSIIQYDPGMILGILQCSEYIDALYASVVPQGEQLPEEAERWISLRRERQELLYRDDRPRMTYLMTESALKYQVGSTFVMMKQAKHLIYLIREHRIDIRIIPFTSGFVVGMTKPSILVEIGKENPVKVAYYDLSRYGQLVEDEDTISMTEQKLNLLMRAALSPTKTAELLENYYE